MNFLAHAFLSGEDPKILTGNFIADFVKGRQALQSFEPRIAKGIELHRFIDEFTDHHMVVKESKKRLQPKYRHYSGVIVDVFYDHYLAKNWNNFHADPLPQFADHVYRIIESNYGVSPEGIRHMLPYMITGNWLVNYGKIEGIGSALSGMSRRTPYESKMNEAVDDLREHYELFKSEFEEFFPELNSVCRDWRIRND
jgi:acyl carrier protein phosphodiesterase